VLRGVHAVTAVPQAVKIHPADNVVVAVRPLVAGCEVVVDDDAVVLRDAVPAGHKIAIRTVEPGEPVVKYGFPIGVATAAIPPGAWVHTHNLKTCLDGVEEYRYQPAGVGVRHAAPLPPGALDGQRATPTFAGYRRRNGRVGTRNEVWILNTVGCVNHAAEQIGRTGAARFAGRIDGVFSFSHPYGCSQLGDDLQNTQRILAGLLRHPNAGACWRWAWVARTTSSTSCCASPEMSTASGCGSSIRRKCPTRSRQDSRAWRTWWRSWSATSGKRARPPISSSVTSAAGRTA